MEHDDVIIEEELYELEVLDGEVMQQSTELAPAPPAGRGLTWASAPALQTAAVAATGFVAGAATLALLRRYALRAREAELLAEGLSSRGAPPLMRRGGTYLVQVRQIVPPQ